MLGYFPPVYKKELFYSTIARYHSHSGNSSLSQTTKDLFDKTQIKANVEFVSNLPVIFTKLEPFNYIDMEKIIEEHTMFPYFSFFIDNGLREELKQVLIEGSGVNKLYTKLGLQGHKVRTHSFLKLCKKCYKEDVVKLGEGYWHLDHQLPSSFICLVHDEILVDSNVPFRPKTRTEFVPLTIENYNNERNNQTIEFIKIHYSIFKAITQLGLELFKSPNFKNDKLPKIYRHLLGLKGYLSANGSVKQIELGQSLEEFYGEKVLRYLNCSVRPGDNSCWLRLITSKHRSIFHPIYHLLLLNFLDVPLNSLNTITDIDYKPFSIGPYPCLNPAAEHFKELTIREVSVKRDQNTGKPRGLFKCKCGYEYVRIGPDKNESDIYRYNKVFEYGPIWKDRLYYLVLNQGLTYKEAAERLHVSDQTVSRYMNNFKKKPKKPAPTLSKLDILKERWRTLLKENPSHSQDQIRRKDMGLYTLLYTYDKEWLKRHSPQFVPFSTGNNRVDWDARDKKYIELVKITVEKIKRSPDKPERITINKIEMETGLNFIRANLNKLPRIKEYLEGSIESLNDFQIRKAKWALKHLENNNEEVTLPKIKQLLNLYNSISTEVIEEINELLNTKRNFF